MLAGPLLTEGAMRFLLFHPSELALRHGAHLRQAGLFADPRLEDEYWLLKAEFDLRKASRLAKSGQAVAPVHPPHDAQLGWVSQRIEPGTYLHKDVDQLRGRRPILLYGASYAGRLPSCFLEATDLDDDYCLLNYGVGGSGIGQALLLMRSSLGHYQELDPIVVLGLVTDSDFDRAVLRFRTWPKARLVLRDGRLVPEGPVPTGESQAYLAAHGIGIVSYAWRYVLYSAGLPPQGWRAVLAGHRRAIAKQRELIEAIVLAIREELEQRGLSYFFLLCSSQDSLPPNEVSEREAWIVGLCEEHGIPFVQSRDVMLEASAGDPVKLRSYFEQEGTGKNHPTSLGNRMITRSLVREVRRLSQLEEAEGAR